MINWNMISKIMGALLFFEAALMSLSLGISVYSGEGDTPAFVTSVGLILLAAIVFRYFGLKAGNRLSRKDAYMVVTLSWVVFSLFGSLPFMLSGYVNNFTDAFFENMSGFTTTGATVIDDVEALPHGLLFWRSFTQWIGGLGIVFFTVALLPSLDGGYVKVFSAEITGPIQTKLHPRLSMGAKYIWMVYVCLTAACAGCYWIFGMSPWESINYAMTSTATGGFSIYNDSMENFHSPALEYTCTTFCFLAGINFTLLYFSVARRRIGMLFKSDEFKFYLFMAAACTAFVMFQLMAYRGYDAEHAFRCGAFQVVNFLTTTGLFNDNAALWPHVTWVVLAVCMFVGACSGSTSGAFKSIRSMMVLKVIRNELRQILHPNAVLPLRVDGVNVPIQKRVTLLAFLATYVIMLLVVAFIMIACGIDHTNAITICLSSLGNVGPSLGLEIGPTMSWSQLPDLAKWTCSFMMLVGRLEIFTVLVIFSPTFWKDN